MHPQFRELLKALKNQYGKTMTKRSRDYFVYRVSRKRWAKIKVDLPKSIYKRGPGKVLA